MSSYAPSQVTDGRSLAASSPYRTERSYSPLKSPAIAEYPGLQTEAAQVKEPNSIVSTYRAIAWMFGFRDRYSLLWFFFFGGALLGYCLHGSIEFNPKNIVGQSGPGDFFYYARKFFKVNYYIHVYLTLIGGIFVGLQFMPALRRRAVILHRINGYFCLVCLLPGNITGSIVAVKSFGGEINQQAAFYILGIMIVFSGLIGIYNVKKQTRQHRKWMLRLVTYFSVIITAKIIMFIARRIVSDIGTYYSVWRCDEMLYLASNLTAARELYPTCFAPGVDLSKVSVAVHASLKGEVLNVSSAVRVTIGMALWVATLIHVIGVEIYIHFTETLNHNRYGYVLEPVDYDGNGEPLWDYGK